MARIQEDVTQVSWDLLLRFLGITGEVVGNVERAGEFTIDLLGKGLSNAGKAARGLLGLMIENARKKAREKGADSSEEIDTLEAMHKRATKNNEELRNVIVADEEAVAFTEKLKENGVLFVMHDIDRDNAKMIMYLSGDDYSVQKALDSLLSDRGLMTEMSAEEFIDVRLKNGVGTVDSLDDAELEVFRKYAKSEQFPYAQIRTSNNKNLIIYEPEKSSELKNVLKATAWALSSRQGDKIRNSLDASIKARKELYLAIEDKKEHVILSAKKPESFLVIDDKEAVLYKNGKKVQNVSRENIDFREKALQMADGLEDAVVLNKSDYSLNGTKEELTVSYHREMVNKKMANRLSEKELDDLFEDANERLRLVEEKMILDDEHEDPFWLFDESYSYSVASEHEKLDGDDKERHQEQEEIEKTSRKLKSFEIDEVAESAPRGIDAIIARVERRRTEKDKAEKETLKEERFFKASFDRD